MFTGFHEGLFLKSTWADTIITFVFGSCACVVSCRDPTRETEERVWGRCPIPRASLTWINFCREFFNRQSPCRNTIFGYNTRNAWLLQHFLTPISCQFATMDTVSCEFLMKAEESAECHQTLSSWVGSGARDYRTCESTFLQEKHACVCMHVHVCRSV